MEMITVLIPPTPLIAGITASAVFCVIMLWYWYHDRKEKIANHFDLHGETAEVVELPTASRREYLILVKGERWKAICDHDLALHDLVKIMKVTNNQMILKVAKEK